MGTQITFTVDDNFTDADLKLLVAYSDAFIALSNIKEQLRLMYRDKIAVPESASGAVELIYDFVLAEMKDLPEIY